MIPPESLPESPVPSPCTNICRMNPATGWCSGCWRTLDEIASWSTMEDDAKRLVWSLLPARRAEHEAPPVMHRRVVARSRSPSGEDDT